MKERPIIKCDKIIGNDGEIYTVIYEVDSLIGMMPRKVIEQMEAEQQKRAEDAVNDINERR